MSVRRLEIQGNVTHEKERARELRSESGVHPASCWRAYHANVKITTVLK